MRLGLMGRILLGGGILVLVLSLEFVLVVHSFRSVQRNTQSEQRAEQTVVVGTQIEKLVLDLETGTRGYVITRNPRFLQPWREAQRDLPAKSRLLKRLAPAAWTIELDRQWRAYLARWSEPLVRLTAANPRAAAARIAEGGGKRRIDAIRHLVDREL